MTRKLRNIAAFEAGGKTKIQIALVDDSYLFRSLLHYILTEKLDRNLGVFEFSTPKDFLTSLRKTPYQILIVDINLIENIPNFTQMISALNPRIKIMALSAAISKETFCLIFKAGFNSYLSKESSVEEIAEGVKYFITNGTYLDPKTTNLTIDLIRDSVNFDKSSALEKN